MKDEFEKGVFSLHPSSFHQPRCDLARNRRCSLPESVFANLASCLVVRPCVRFRHILNEFAVISDRISLMTSPGERPNWVRIASKLVRSSQAIMMMRSISPRVSSLSWGSVIEGMKDKG